MSKKLHLLAPAVAMALAACSTTGEMKMTPAAGTDVGVRFSRGEARMLSGQERGAILLAPLRYNEGNGKIVFVLAAYNHSGQPVNFGSENVRIDLDDGRPVPVQDFDTFRYNTKARADHQRALALIEAGLATYRAYRISDDDPRRARRVLDRAWDRYDWSMYSIADNLARGIATMKATILQTTTIDPATYWYGAVLADQPPLGRDEVRRMRVTVRFAGEQHRFVLFLARQGVPTPSQLDLPAVWRADMENLYATPETWLFDQPQVVRQEQSVHRVTRF